MEKNLKNYPKNKKKIICQHQFYTKLYRNVNRELRLI